MAVALVIQPKSIAMLESLVAGLVKQRQLVEHAVNFIWALVLLSVERRRTRDGPTRLSRRQ